METIFSTKHIATHGSKFPRIKQNINYQPEPAERRHKAGEAAEYRDVRVGEKQLRLIHF